MEAEKRAEEAEGRLRERGGQGHEGANGDAGGTTDPVKLVAQRDK